MSLWKLPSDGSVFSVRVEAGTSCKSENEEEVWASAEMGANVKQSVKRMGECRDQRNIRHFKDPSDISGHVRPINCL